MRLDKFSNVWQQLSDANRPIRLFIALQEDGSTDLFLAQQVSGVETMCGAIVYSVRCVAQTAGLALKQLIACPVQLQFVTASGALQAISGIVSEVHEGGSDGALASYQLIVRDAFSLLDQSCNTRVFLEATEVDITNTLLSEWRQSNPSAAHAFRVDVRCQHNYPARPFTMQYNESTASFLRRLWKRRGIAWFFESGPVVNRANGDVPYHTLVLFDSPQALNENPAGPARFHRDHATQTRDSIYAWHSARTLTAGRVARHSWNERRSASMESAIPSMLDQGVHGNAFAMQLEEYVVDPPQVDLTNQHYRDLAVLRMQRKEYEGKLFRGESGDRDMCVGMWRRVEGEREIDSHPDEEQEFTFTELRIEAENNLPAALDQRVRRLFDENGWIKAQSSLAAASVERQMRYTNRFTCVRRSVPIVPSYDVRSDLPRTTMQTAIVVGPENNAIYCNAAGQIKIRFPAAREEDHQHAHGAGSSGSERDSAWVRVASSWAGNRFGALSLPRAGDEVVVIFLGGDPDQPLVVGCVHGHNTPPPSFDRISILPGDRHLSGIVSREDGSHRINQMRMDDTPGQINAQLASEHGHSQLNLGYLVHPRCDGRAEPRGVGAELRTDAAVAVRGGEGVLISADASLRAAGRQLTRDGLAGLAGTLEQIHHQLAQFSETHHAAVADGAALAQLREHVAQWEAGGNTDSKVGGSRGAAMVAVEAPAGILLGSQAGIAFGAQTHIDAVSVGNTQVSAGRRLLLHAMESISLFAHALGVKLIAASGKVELASHDDDIELTAAKRIVLSASDEIILQAPKISVITKGAQVAYGDGAVFHQCTGKFSVKSSSVDFAEGGDAAASPMQMPASSGVHDQHIRIVDMSSGEPMANQRYRATLEDGQVLEGKTDVDGMTQVLRSTIPFAHFDIEALDD